MKLRYEGTVRGGRAVDARDLDVDAAAVVGAIRGAATDAAVRVQAPAPTPVHDRVGYVRPGMGLAVKTALAVAARTRGHSAPQDEQLAAVRTELAALEVPDASTRAARRALAGTEAESDLDRLRERVAELRGRVQTLRERDADTEAAEADLAGAARRLAEAETEQVAAEQRLADAAAAAREARDIRDRRMRLEDRAGNLARAARAHLVDTVADEYRAAVAGAPGPTPQDPFAADTITAALAVARVAALRAPVVLACDRFAGPEGAADWLDARVVRL